MFQSKHISHTYAILFLFYISSDVKYVLWDVFIEVFIFKGYFYVFIDAFDN